MFIQTRQHVSSTNHCWRWMNPLKNFRLEGCLWFHAIWEGFVGNRVRADRCLPCTGQGTNHQERVYAGRSRQWMMHSSYNTGPSALRFWFGPVKARPALALASTRCFIVIAAVPQVAQSRREKINGKSIIRCFKTISSSSYTYPALTTNVGTQGGGKNRPIYLR